jgi:hypothetical protein
MAPSITLNADSFFTLIDREVATRKTGEVGVLSLDFSDFPNQRGSRRSAPILEAQVHSINLTNSLATRLVLKR